MSHRRINDLFDPNSFRGIFADLFGKSLLGPAQSGPAVASPEQRSAFRPVYHITNEPGSLVLDIELPGINPPDVSVWVTRDKVLVKHPVCGGAKTGAQKYTIASEYDLSTAEATMADGVLRVRIAEASPQEPRRIPIEYATHRS